MAVDPKDTPQIKLPEVVVTPEEPNHMAQGLVAGSPGFLSAAQQKKHTEILPTDAQSAYRIADYAGADDLHAPLWNPRPGQGPEPVMGSPDLTMRTGYAEALKNGEVATPQEYAERYFGSLWGTVRDHTQSPEEHMQDKQAKLMAWMTNAAKGLGLALPSNEKFIDYSIGTAQLADAPLTPEHVAVVHDNLIQHWTETGEDPATTYEKMQHDPMLADVMTHTQPPMSYDDLKRRLPPGMLTPGRDAIHDPLGNMFNDPIGLVEQAKGIYGLGAEWQAWQEKMIEKRKKGEPITHEDFLANPVLKFSAEFLFMGLVGKAVGTAVRGVKKQLPAAKDTLTELWRDERGGPADVGTPGPNPPPKPPVEGQPAPAEPTPAELKTAVNTAVGKLARGKKITVPAYDQLKPPGLEEVRPYVSRLDDELYRLRTNDVADKVELTKLVAKMPKGYLDKGFQQRAYNEIETRLIDPAAATSPEITEYKRVIKPLTDRELELGRRIRAKLKEEKTGKEVLETDPSLTALKSVDQGYVHRIRIGDEGTPQSKIDPSLQQGDIITGHTPKSLTKFAPGMQSRTQYVLDDGAGNRVFGSRPLDKITNPSLAPEQVGKKFVRQTAQYGDKITDGNGREWTIKPATTEEIEANTDYRYRKNHLANLTENVARLSRIDRNLDFLQSTAKELEDQNMFMRKTPGMNKPIPEGFQRVEVPGMDGWAHPKLAQVLNDFFKEFRGDLDGLVTRINRVVMGALFISPITHAGNVAAHWAVGRGWEWIRPSGYGSLMLDGARALKEVTTMGPRYIEHLRQGSGLMYAGTQTENFYRTIMSKIMNETMGDERTWGAYAKSFGFLGAKDLASTMYRWSRYALWHANDVFMMQRQFELERRGYSMKEAIHEAEKDIPNYRVPSEVMGQKWLGDVLKSPNFMNFGRYKYGQVRAIALVVKDLLDPRATGQARLDAIGKLTMGAVMAMATYPLVNSMLQYVTGNNLAEVKPFGPFTLLHSAVGFASGQLAWGAAVASWITLAPVINIAGMVVHNIDQFGRHLIEGKSTTIGQVTQAIESAGNQVYPAQLLLKTMKDGPGALGELFGLKLPPPKDPKKQAAYDRMDAAIARSREKKSTLENWFRGMIGEPLPSKGGGGIPGASRGGGGGRGNRN